MHNHCPAFRHWVRGVALSGLALVAAWTHAADEAKPADDGPKITYAEHVQPILREHCLICHNQNETKGGLALDNYAAVMEGGSSGEIVFAGDLDSSRLWALVNHDEQPYMPPNQNRIADAKLDLLKRWIEDGALQDAGSKATVKKKASMALSGPVSTGRPENPAMPEGLWKQPVLYTTHPGAVTALAASPWAPVVAVAGQKQVALYHSDSGQLLGILPFPEGLPYVVRFSRDGSLLLAAGGRGAHSGCAVLFDVKTGRRVAKVGDELDAVLAADVSPDHARIALSGPQRLIRIFATDTGEKLYEIKKHTDWVYAIAYSPDGVLLATADRANGIFVWEADTARQYLDLRGHTGAVCGLAWRPDSNVLASCSQDGTVKLWEMVEGKTVKSWPAHGGGAQSVEYTHDGRLATVGRDKTAKLWDGEGKPLRQFPGFPEPALKVAFTHDGNRVVAGDWSGQVSMWEAADGNLVGSPVPNPPTLAMIVEAAQAKHNAAQAAAQQAQAEWAALQTAAT
jgi:WD40 repeat protein